jgi:hypothetical protein
MKTMTPSTLTAMRRERAQEVLDDFPTCVELPADETLALGRRYLLVLQNHERDTDRPYALRSGPDLDALLASATGDGWDGWVPTRIYDLDVYECRDVKARYEVAAPFTPLDTEPRDTKWPRTTAPHPDIAAIDASKR